MAKRTAEEAFGAEDDPTAAIIAEAMARAKNIVATGAPITQITPLGADGKPLAMPAPAPVAAPQGQAVPSGSSDIIQQLQSVSAVRCASIVQEKGQNFSNAAAIEALHTMAQKSSFKLREELVKQPHVRRLCNKVLELLRKPPSTVNFELLAKAAWCMTRFPDDICGDAEAMLAPAARHMEGKPAGETSIKLLWSMARSKAIIKHKHLVSHVVADLVADKGLRLNEISMQGCADLLFAISRSRQHSKKGDHPTVHIEENDEICFNLVGKRVIDNIDKVAIQILTDLVLVHHECGLRREPLFRAICPRVVSAQGEIQESTMAKVIKAYTRFMIPLRAERQGHRTVAIVSKGDFQRPSEKPKRTGKVEFDKPQALFPKTQVHSRA